METKNFKIAKIIISIFVFICLTFSISLTAYYFSLNEGEPAPYFIEHFAIGLSLASVGICALLMVFLNKHNINSTDKGDNVMIMVGALLIIFGIGTIIFSYL